MSLDTLEAGIDPDTLAELEALALERGRPLVALDCDEVLVEFSAHVARWLTGIGYEMRLTSYRLEGSMFRRAEPHPLPFDECIALLDRFFTEETRAQRALPGAVEAVGKLAATAQVIVLTNVPRHAREDRVANLRALGIDVPVIVNSGGKGRPLAWLARAVEAPVVFADDSSIQIGSAAKHAPDVGRIYFRGSPFIRSVMPDSPEADVTADDWDAALAGIGQLLARGE
jgi:hypothetical protein